jgi:hypothetical protein
MIKRVVPIQPTIKKWCEEMGCWREFIKRREELKKQGMEAKDAIKRTYMEMEIKQKYEEYRQVKAAREMKVMTTPLTDGEAAMLMPGKREPGLGKDVECGNEAMSLADELSWVWNKRALARTMGEQPERFPNSSVAGWWHEAIRNPEFFNKAYMNSAGGKMGDESEQRDYKFQMEELERQIQGALKEVGEELERMEGGFAEILKGNDAEVGG